MSPTAGKIVLRSPRTVGQIGEYSALTLCRDHARASGEAADAAREGAATAQLHASVALAAREALYAAAGAVKASPTDLVPASLDDTLAVAAPLAKAVADPGENERIELSVSVMAGAGAGEDGAPGVVPRPLAGDQGAFLRGDGTWKRLERADAGMASVEDSWTELAGPVEVLSPRVLRVPGNRLDAALPGGVAGRAVRAGGPGGVFGVVAGAAFDEASGRTTVVVEGPGLEPGCAPVELGQDPRNAPDPPDAGASLFLAANFNCLLY